MVSWGMYSIWQVPVVTVSLSQWGGNRKWLGCSRPKGEGGMGSKKMSTCVGLVSLPRNNIVRLVGRQEVRLGKWS